MKPIEQGRFAVVGSSGFIGRVLVERLRRDGARVAAISRHVADPRDLEIASYLDEGALQAAVGEGCDALFHLAALAHRRDVDDEAFVRANVETALAAARVAIAGRVRRFVFVSSIGVIGSESGGTAFTETTTPRPSASYARSKWQAEQVLRALLEPSDVELVIVRPPLVHGPGAPGNFGRLATLARRPLPLPLGGIDGNARSMVGIDNLVDFLLTAARHPAAPDTVLLVTDGEDISTAALLKRLVSLSGGRGAVIQFPVAWIERIARYTGRHDMARQLIGSLRVDASRSASMLEWSPPLSLDAGLARAMGAAS